MPSAGKTVADGYIELRLDDSKLEPEVKTKVAKVTNTFGSRLNKELQALDIEPIDLQADPREALRQIERTEDKLKEMARDAPTVEVKVRTEAALRQLGAFSKKVGNVVEDAAPPAALGFAAKLSKRLGPLIGALPLAGPMSTAMAAAGVATAPLLASVLAGAIIGGAGIGGVVGGLAVAAKDGRVKDAAKTLGDEFEQRLEDAGGAFVQPALDGIKRIDEALDTVDVRRIFADSSRYVDVLADAAGNSITMFGDALEKLVANAGPVVKVIGAGIERITASLSAGMVSLADNGEEAATALDTTFDVIAQGITITFQLVNALTELYGIGKKIGADIGLQLILKATRQTMDETAESARRVGSGTFGMGDNLQIAASKADQLKAAAEELKPAQEELAAAQKILAGTLDNIGRKHQNAALTANSLRTAYQNLYGATISQTDANEAYQESFDNLSETVKTNSKEFKSNKDNLDLHTRAGRSNRDALEDLLTKSGELYFADIAAGKSVAYATGEHKKRTAQVLKEAEKVGLNKEETEKLNRTYGKIPGKKATDLLLQGVGGVVEELKKLYTLQRALALGINVNLVTGTGTVKNFKATGGAINGPGTGTSDDVPVMASHGEHMWTAQEVRAAGGHSAMHAMRKAVLGSARNVGHYATGGAILTAVDSSRRWPFRTNLENTKIMSVEEAESKVIPAFGAWPSSPSAQRGDSGVWRRILAMVRASGIPFAFGNSYRPGDPKWHGSGRAIDFMGFNQDRLANFFMNMKSRVLELIHRTNKRDYGVTRGHNARMPTQWPLHRNHLHIAMDDGGYRMLQPGLNLIPNNTGRPELIGGPAALASLGGEIHLHFHGPVASKQAAEDMVVEGYRAAKQRRRI